MKTGSSHKSQRYSILKKISVLTVTSGPRMAALSCISDTIEYIVIPSANFWSDSPTCNVHVELANIKSKYQVILAKCRKMIQEIDYERKNKKHRLICSSAHSQDQ